MRNNLRLIKEIESMGMKDVVPNEGGIEMYRLVSTLYPICRSITGSGVRKTLNIIKQYIPLEINEVPTGTKVFDWTIPKEWNIREAYIKNSKGEKIVDFNKNNLHVINYSIPINKKSSLGELKQHLFTLPEYPDWIPYRTSLCNDNLSGISVVTFLAKALKTISPRYSYRFLFIPGTIGSITWLCLNEPHVTRIKHGLVAACLGDP